MAEQRWVNGAGGVLLAVYERNVGADETVVLVHGYPDNHRVWDPVADLLAERFHVVTYDVRGAGLSDTPEAVHDYDLGLLSADFVAVVNDVVPDGRQVHLVGHDWGSIQGWHFVCQGDVAEHVASYTSISGPNLDAVGAFMHRSGPNPPELLTVLGQGVKSWYVGVFQIPKLAPSYWGSKAAKATWPKMLAKVERVPAEHLPTGEDLEQSQRDGAHGVKLYRANMLGPLRSPQPVRTSVPVQVVVPLRDRYVSPALAQSVAHLGDDIVFRQIDGGHWIVLSDPDLVASLITEHIDRQAAAAAVRAKLGWD